MPTVSAIAIVARGALLYHSVQGLRSRAARQGPSRAVVLRQRSLTAGTVGRGSPGVSLSVRIVARLSQKQRRL